MNMTLSKRGDYVMRSAIFLARAFDQAGHRKIREVVADTNVPTTFASQVLADLVRAGLATSRSGREGGYRLTRPPSDITVLEVVEAAEGPLRAERCALGEGPCRWEAVCPLHETWSEATAMLRDLLARTSLAEMASRDAAIEAGNYPAPIDSHRLHRAAIDVSDVVQVELSTAEAHLALARSARRLGELVSAAVFEADAGTDAGAAGSPAERRRAHPAVEATLAPVGEGAGSEETAEARYLLAWRALGVRGEKSSRFEADLFLGALDAERSELRAEGTWYQEDAGSAVGPAELDKKARRALRALLRSLAWELEGPARSPTPAGSPRTPRRKPALSSGAGRARTV
jgi:Rrf2 family protein